MWHVPMHVPFVTTDVGAASSEQGGPSGRSVEKKHSRQRLPVSWKRKELTGLSRQSSSARAYPYLRSLSALALEPHDLPRDLPTTSLSLSLSLFRANQRKARPTGQALYHSRSDGWPFVGMPAWLPECRVRQQSSMLCSSDTISDTISRAIDRASPRGADLRLVT